MAKMDMGKLFHAQVSRKFRFLFTVYGLGGSTTEDPITAYVKSVTSPSLTLEPVEVIHQTEKVYYPGRITWSTIDVTITDVDGYEDKDSGESPLEFIWEKWIKKYYTNPEFGYVSWKMSEIKKKAELASLSPAGVVTGKWVMEGCWPTVLSPGDWDYASSEPQEMTLTIQFDRAYYVRS